MHVQLTSCNQPHSHTRTKDQLNCFVSRLDMSNDITAYEPGVLRQNEFVGQIECPRPHSSSSSCKEKLKLAMDLLNTSNIPTQAPYLKIKPGGH